MASAGGAIHHIFMQIKGSDRIAVRTRTAKLGNKSFNLEQEIFDTDTQEVKSRCLSILVLYDLEQKQSLLP
jgi:acyl-CoA thioester hydrolase